MFEKDPNAKAVPEPDTSARYYDDDEEDEADDDNCPYDEPDFPATYRRSSGPHAFAPFVDEDMALQPDLADHQADDPHHDDAHPHPHDSSMETSDAGDTSFEVPVKGNDSLDTTAAASHDESDVTASSLGSLGHLDALRTATDEMDDSESWPQPSTPASAPPTLPSMIAASGMRNDAALTFPVSPIHAPDLPPNPVGGGEDDEASTANLTATLQASVVQDDHAQYEFDLNDGLTGVISRELSSDSSPAPPRLYPTIDDGETNREDDALARYLAQVAPSSSAASARASPATPQPWVPRGIVDGDDDDDKTTTLPRRIATPSPTAASPIPTFTPPPAPATTAWTPGLSTPRGGGESTSLLDLYGGIASPTAPRATPPSRSTAPSPLTLLDAFSPPRERNPFLSVISERTEPESPKAVVGKEGVASPLMKRLHAAAAGTEPESPRAAPVPRMERADAMDVDGEDTARSAHQVPPLAEHQQPMNVDGQQPSSAASTDDVPPLPADAQLMDVDSNERPASTSSVADPVAPPTVPATAPDVPMTPIGSLPSSSSPALIDSGLVSPPPPVAQHPPPQLANEARSPSPEAELSLLDLFPPLESSSSETVPPQAQAQDPTADVQQTQPRERTPEAVPVPRVPTPEVATAAPAAPAHATSSSTPPPPPPLTLAAADPIAAPEKSDLDSMFELLERQLREASREMTEATQRNLQVLADSPVRQERYARPASAMRIGTPTAEPPAKRRRLASSPAISSPLARDATPRYADAAGARRRCARPCRDWGVGDVWVTPLVEVA
ncbi:hypothetical protein AMAG_20200 [Allomyces macrogynus ATCC 38327]|uniref:Uncharacterized protein n=1 Tax=Allomyces macrogynus (strain ATCC 38327) TaxID=578462 RepID=A0A0L0T800_ALLM3|nr:hypothetical protein AMAG_20200 [Allomyces macrogynus ATCC 38327]|eukprot:KNE70877.1 hypothetical protein AMAG_20200 [Allomyces macrogynus ATCC 38327]